jgi:hypothetical protein
MHLKHRSVRILHHAVTCFFPSRSHRIRAVTGPCQNRSPHRKRPALEALMRGFAFALSLTFLPTAATGTGGADQERARRVLMLFSESKDLPANIFLERATRAELEKRSRARLEFYAEHLAASRFPGESHYRLFREYLSEKYGRERPDLVMVFVGRDFALAGELPQKLFPNLPIIFVAVNELDIRSAAIGSHDFAGTGAGRIRSGEKDAIPVGRSDQRAAAEQLQLRRGLSSQQDDLRPQGPAGDSDQA